MANTMDAIFQVGKGDIGEMQLKGIEEALSKRELIKISVLRNSPTPAKDAAQELAQKLSAELVAVTGGKILLYKRSNDKNVKHIEF